MDETAPKHDNPLVGVPIAVSVSVGQALPTVRELLALEKDSVLLLDKRIEDPVELYVGSHLIARGVLEEDGENNRLSVRLTEVIAPERVV